MDSNIYTSPVVSGPSDTMEPQGCIVANECGGAFGTIVIVGGAVLVGVAVYCPPAIIIATFA